MSPSIHLSRLSWFTPEGRALFDDLDLHFGRECCGLVGRNGVGKSTLLRLIAGEIAPRSGKVIVDGSIAVLRQLVEPPPGLTVADLFGRREALALLARALAGDASVDEMAEADWTLEARLEEALAEMGVPVPPDTPLASLSGGQRTRAALAAAAFDAPDFLLFDEPTNNLDREGRQAVIDLLMRWRNGAIVVSHDRELLDHMQAIVELSTLGAVRYGGNWADYRAQKSAELEAVRHDVATAERRADEVGRKAQIASERLARRDAGGRRKAGRGDMPKILLGKRRQQAEESGCAHQRNAERMRAEAGAAVSAARARLEIIEPIRVTMPSTGLASDRVVLVLDGLLFGHDLAKPLAAPLDLVVRGPERVAIVGPNGSGKSTLLATIAGHLPRLGGTVRCPLGAVMLDQQVSLLDRSLSIADNFAVRHPGATRNACRAALARFRFRAEAADQVVGTLSGGQMLRAGLACVLGGENPPPLLLLDEPTNHLDLEAIEAVEAGLSAYDGALLVVSHDEAFLDAIGIGRRLHLPAGTIDPG
ncbi:ATP-binding cassette domain-containing protein [Rhizorhabdus sp. FW153]|uniref:ATP-binding cassette domain-containing protein n=1 Tax=Rhizorhabdus sp. FW153 TaxID=3400216 RepID=UPI003CFAE0E9